MSVLLEVRDGVGYVNLILPGAGNAFCAGLDFTSVGRSAAAFVLTGRKLPGQKMNLFQHACWV
ncbi:hypothetical protein [Rugosimonospora africana]|uniref:Enoyl-CoA hydratase n=1 Tax=Rugosimonospora africana TaxID=556532 RepID=A0A8J3R2B4_9ACTN|nr:hypothetical protein [Rugosimonospora africana]GIH21168.1 hypothetical protein Raf01_93400 [Rugosimonospora africana]